MLASKSTGANASGIWQRLIRVQRPEIKEKHLGPCEENKEKAYLASGHAVVLPVCLSAAWSLTEAATRALERSVS